MLLSPDTEIKFLHVPISLDQKNQLTFNSKNEQAKYFLDNVIYEFDEVSFQRENNVIRLNKNYDECYNLNYVMYQNNVISNKWIYAFITGKTYVNENRTDIQIVTDVFQTWQFDMKFNDSFVEREMCSVSDDVPGNYLQPENLEIGEPKISGTANLKGLNPYFVVAYSRNPYDDGLTQEKPAAQGAIVNGVPSGVFYCVCTSDMLQGLLQTINSKGFGDSIISVFTVPCFAFVGVNNWTIDDVTNNKSKLMWIIHDYTAPSYSQTLISRPNSVDGYTPRNKKLLTYPFLYIGFNPPNAQQKIYRYEDFKNASPTFNFYSEVNPNPSVFMIPQNYRGASGNSLSDASVLSGYPQIGWVSEYYSSWLVQNSKTFDISMQQEQYNYEIGQGYKAVEGLRNLGSNIGNNKLISAGADLAITNQQMIDATQNYGYYIQSMIAQKEKQSLLPNSAQLGTNSTIIGYKFIDDNIFTRYNIKAQFARVIDDYFDMYGYAINQVKKPNLRNRPNWNYIKTIGANITGKNISQSDILALKNMFDNGVTLWHNPDNFLDYSKKNR